MSKFQPLTFYSRKAEDSYRLLPFRFTRFRGDNVLVTNMVGEYQMLSSKAFEEFTKHQLTQTSSEYINLRSKHFLLDESNEVAIDLLALKLRTKLSRLSDFTALHIFVATLRCEHSCPYCQVSRQSEDKNKYDMSIDIADKAIDMVFKSPSLAIKIEFQGGEPLLNFDLIKYVVKKAKFVNQAHQRHLDFVIATNLAVVTSDILNFCRDNKVHISTIIRWSQRFT
jgi:uncharacterized protein